MNTLQEELAELVNEAVFDISHMPLFEDRQASEAELVAAIIAAYQARLPKKEDGDEYADGWNDCLDAVNEVLGGTE